MNLTIPSLACLLASGFFYTKEPLVSMREFPTDQSKVVSQALFHEWLTVEETSGDWVLIATPDKYTGWIRANRLQRRAEPYTTEVKTTQLMAHIYAVKDTEYGPITSLPYGSQLKVLDDSDARWLKVLFPDGLECYIQRGDVAPRLIPLNKSDLTEFSKQFERVPYLWGGRSSFGYDCSGFIQMLYSQIGIDLQRDSRQQILDNRFQTIAIDRLEAGDLVFFGQSEETIQHVGLYIGNDQFIHATVQENQPWIRISRFTDFVWSGDPEAHYPYRTARQMK